MSNSETRSTIDKLQGWYTGMENRAMEYLNSREGALAVAETSIGFSAGMILSTLSYDPEIGINTWTIGLPAVILYAAGTAIKARGRNIEVPDPIEIRKPPNAVGKTLMDHLGSLLREVFTERRIGYIRIHANDLRRSMEEERRNFDTKYLARKKALLIHSGRVIQAFSLGALTTCLLIDIPEGIGRMRENL